MAVTVDISKLVTTHLHTDNVQVFSLLRLPPQLCDRYEQGHRQALLLYDGSQHKGRIRIAGDHHLAVTLPSQETIPAPDSHVLVALTTDTAKRFVIQTVVERLDGEFCVLRVLDPRLYPRYPGCENHILQFRPVPFETARMLANGEIRLLRTKIGLASKQLAEVLKHHQQESTTVTLLEENDAALPESLASGTEAVIDTLFEQDRTQVAEAQHDLQKKSPTVATMADISLGGICLNFVRKSDRSLAHRLLYVDLRCPAARAAIAPLGAAGTLTLHLQTFVAVRHHQRPAEEPQDHLHLMFLHQLPEAVAYHFHAPGGPANGTPSLPLTAVTASM